jgi:hypothetical protein
MNINIHVTLALLAHAYLTVVRTHASLPGPTVGVEMVAELLPLTVPEVRHLLWQVLWLFQPPLELVLAWSRWRRRHQARAKQAHTKRRHTRQMGNVLAAPRREEVRSASGFHADQGLDVQPQTTSAPPNGDRGAYPGSPKQEPRPSRESRKRRSTGQGRVSRSPLLVVLEYVAENQYLLMSEAEDELALHPSEACWKCQN